MTILSILQEIQTYIQTLPYVTKVEILEKQPLPENKWLYDLVFYFRTKQGHVGRRKVGFEKRHKEPNQIFFHATAEEYDFSTDQFELYTHIGRYVQELIEFEDDFLEYMANPPMSFGE